MRIVYISNSTIPSTSANSVAVMGACDAMARMGNAVTLIGFYPGRRTWGAGATADHAFSLYGMAMGFRLVRMMKIPVFKWGYIYCLMAALWSWWNRAELVYTRIPLAGWFSGWLGIPYAIELHYEVHKSGRASKWIFNRACRSRHYRGTVFISEELRRRTNAAFGEVNHACVEASGTRIPPAVSAPVRGERVPRVCYVGGLYEGRGVELLCSLARRLPGVEFVVVGGTEEQVSWGRACSGGIDNMCFVGHVPHYQVSGYMASASVLVAPYGFEVKVMGGAETGQVMSPLKLFEYMAHRRPVVASDVPAIRCLVEDGLSAVLCHPSDVESWARAIVRLIEDEDYAHRVTEVAYSDVVRRHSWDARMARVIAHVCGERGGP